MKKDFSGWLSFALLSVSLIASSSALAKPVSKNGIPVSSSTPTPATTTPAVPDATATTSVVPAAPQPSAAAAGSTPDSMKFGSLILNHPHLSANGNNIDVFVSIENNGKGDEKILGVSSTWDVSEAVQVTKDKSGAEQEGPIALDIPAGKSLGLEKGETWIRMKNVKTPSGATQFPVTFYFRSSPNAAINISFKADEGVTSKLMNWFGK